MKKLILIAAIILIITTLAWASSFCAGFERGYVVGYQKASGASYTPFVPSCPFQPYSNGTQSDYEQGFIIGYNQGLREGR